MNNHFTVKRLIISWIVFMLGLLTLLTLLIPLFKVDDPMVNDLITQGFMDITTLESGFTLLDFDGNDGMHEIVAIICGVSSLLQILLSIHTMMFAVLCIFLFNNTTAKKIMRGLAISCLLFIVIYMIWGFIFNYLYKYLWIFDDGRWGLFSYSNILKIAYETKTYTLAYIGLVVGIPLFVVYLVCDITLKEKADIAQNEILNCDILDSNIIEILKKYKDLLDGGIITQEEFDKKKQTILAKN